MAEIAPWENSDLPAPLAIIDREIEGRNRHFALWQWDERLVWRDVKSPKLWWASLDYVEGDTIEIWDAVVETKPFGRVETQVHGFHIAGSSLGFSPRVYGVSQYPGDAFYVIWDDQNSGLWCAKGNDKWQLFYADRKAEAKFQKSNINCQNSSIWDSERASLNIKSLLLKDFIPTLTNVFSPALKKLFESGDEAPFFLLLCDLTAWVVSKYAEARGQKLNQHFDEQFRLLPQLSAYFSLPKEVSFTLYDPEFLLPRIRYEVEVASIRWGINKNIPVSLSSHEILELQLRLRDALRPILTAAEIEEILTLPARQ